MFETYTTDKHINCMLLTFDNHMANASDTVEMEVDSIIQLYVKKKDKCLYCSVIMHMDIN